MAPPGLSLFEAAIRQQESGGDYGAANATGHYGAYQFDQGTWDEALAQAGLGGSVFARELPNQAPPSVQDEAAGALMTVYYNQFGQSWYNVAEAWYGGPGAVGHPNEGGGPGYPTVGQYAASVMAIYARLGGTSQSPVPSAMPLLMPPFTDSFMADVGAHYLNLVEPVWATWSDYAGLTLSNLVTPPGKLV